MERLHLSWAESRQVYGMRRLTEPSRFLSELPHDVVTISRPGRAPLPPPFWPKTSRLVEEDVAPLHVVPDGLRPGVRVRHPLFGVGTVLRSDGEGEGLKLTVSFPGCGAKRLVARYAGLEVL
jgi:DNA helicase-2/ATP-dependent DNA helicase PcrA